MAEKCESGSVYFSSTVTINGCTIKGIALETNHEPTHRIHITLPWGEKKNFVGMTPGSCNFYYTDGHAILCKVCLDRVVGYTCYYTVCRTVSVCSQNIRVKDKDTGVSIANATVAARPSVGSIIRCKTDSNGRCSLTNLIEGDSYRLVVEGIPSGYKCQYTTDCETTITACEGEKTFRLKEEILICEQKIRVVDEGGSLIDASVSVSGATCSHISKGKYKITLSTGDSLKAKATKSGYTDATYDFTACRSEITLTLRKEVAPPEHCYQYVRVETSDGKSVTYEITWGPGTWAMGSTPDTSMLYCEKGKSYTATATASGYTSASKTFTACTTQFTLTLTKEVAPACNTYTTKSSCEAAGCFWFSNSCHEYAPVKCSDYTDALTCAANNCYWWSDGTCHDTEEVVHCSQNVRVVTSDGAGVYPTIYWGDGSSSYGGKTPYDESHKYEKGKGYTIRITASGYKEASRTITACEAKFTLTLTIADVGAINVLSSPDPARIWVKPAGKTHFYDTGYSTRAKIGGLPVGRCDVKLKKEGYKDAIKTVTIYKNETTIVSFVLERGESPECTTGADCPVGYICRDGKCVEEEVPPVSAYDECGRIPTSSDSKTYITNWWKCAYAVGEKRGICHAEATWWWRAVIADAKTELGVTSIYFSSQNLEIDGDYLKIWMGGTYLGRFKWKCPPVVKKDTVICDFNIYDAADKKVTDLVAGVRYAIKAYLCETCKIGILKGCASGKKVSGEELKLFLFGQAAEVASGTTNVDGYTGFYWTPSADIAGDNRIRLEFKGSANYNACESSWKTVTVEKKEKYTINITVKDQDNKPLAGAYVDIDKYTEGVWREVKCSETVITKGTCVADTFAGDKDNIKTDYNGKASFTLPFLPGGIPNKYGFRAGKPGYLNTDWDENYTDRQETKPQPAPQGGTYNYEFRLVDATKQDKFIVHTIGFKPGDEVMCYEAYGWSKCFLDVPLGSLTPFKKPDKLPDGKVVFTAADGLEVGKTYGITTRLIAFLTGPAWCGEFKGTKEPRITRYGATAGMCEFFGIDPASDECRRFIAEFIDPVYVANIITGLTKGQDVYGAHYNPSGFEIAMFPVVLVCSTMPFIPGAKISKFIGKALRIGKKTTKVADYLDADAANIYRATMFGDEARLSKWRKAIEAEDVMEARRITNDIVLNPSISNAEAVKRVKLGLDELDKTINAKIKVGANANDLRRRMVIVADAYMDPDLYIKSMDDAYVEYIGIMQKGTRDKATDVFVRAAADARAKLPWKCKYNVLNATGKLKIGTETLDLLEITKILKKNVKETDVLYKKAFRGLADLKEGDIHGLNFLIDTGAENRVVMELRTHANKIPDKKSFEWLHKQNAWALDKWGTKWLGVKHHSGFAVDYWRSIWAGIRNHTPWLKKVDDISDVMSDAELQKLWSTEVVNDIAIELDKKGRYADASEILRYSVDDPSYFKGGYSNALMDTFVHSDQPSFIAEHIKPLTHAQAAERRAWFHNLKPILKKKLGDVDGERVFKKLGLESLEETSNLNKAFFAYGKSSYDNMVEQAIRGGANRADAEKLATVGLRTQTDFIKAVNMGEITSRKGLFALARRHKVIVGLGAAALVMVPWWFADNAIFLVYLGRHAGFIERSWGEQWDAAVASRKNAYFSLKDHPCVEAFQTQYVSALTKMDTLLKGAKPIPEGKIEYAKYFLSVMYGFNIGDPEALLLDVVKIDFEAWDVEYFMLTQPCITPLKPDWGFRTPEIDEVVHNAKVMNVIDGDTLEVYSEDINWAYGETIRVRTLGANTPEGKTKNYLVRRMATISGEEERWNVDKTLYDKVNKWTDTTLWHKTVTLKSDKDRQWDDYNRFLAVIEKDNVDIGKKQLELGYAPVFFYDANKQVNVSAYLAAEKIAKDANLGVWCFFGDTGKIRCISSPETAVDVYLDGELRGKTVSNVFLMERVSVGTHTIKFKKGLNSCTTSVTVLKDKTVEATCEMTVAGKASFWIDSDPQGAKIYIDGTYKSDLTPANKVFSVDVGTHSFKLVKAGCTTWEKSYTLSEGEEWFYNKATKSKTVPLVCEEPEEPEKGKMHCKTFKPDGKALSNAKIYVTGGKYSNTYMGDTEKTLTIEKGTYTVRYTHPNYTDDCTKAGVVVSTVGISDAVCQFTGEVVPPITPPEEEEAVWHITEAKDAITGAAITRASVYVDDVDVHHYAPEDLTFCEGCKCDTYVNCGFGTHTVKVVKGDKEWTKTRDLKAGDVFTDTPLLEELAAITVTFKSVPKGATVRIDGKLISLFRLTSALKRVKTLGYD